MSKQDSLSYLQLQSKENAQKQNILENNSQKQDNLAKGHCSGTHTENHAVRTFSENKRAPQQASSVPLMNDRPRAEIPVGCAGLFRLPTNFSLRHFSEYFTAFMLELC
ncbi:hypothetical protein ACFE04_010967 [Oxalis oulophora]